MTAIFKYSDSPNSELFFVSQTPLSSYYKTRFKLYMYILFALRELFASKQLLSRPKCPIVRASAVVVGISVCPRRVVGIFILCSSQTNVSYASMFECALLDNVARNKAKKISKIKFC